MPSDRNQYGNTSFDDIATDSDQTQVHEPDRDSHFIIRSRDPLNGGPDLTVLGREFITPTDLFFVRNHGAVPVVDAASYRLNVGGMVSCPVSYSLDDLEQRFERVEIVSTIACAGQRRQEMAAARPIPGELPWGAEAVSTARWSGWRLRDVLDASGTAGPVRHVAFEGLDEVERRGQRFQYGASIPLEKALGEEVLLADRMNGEPLPPEHGYPLRVVVPGYIGARQVKWLAAIELRDESSHNYFQRIAYRRYPPDMDAANLDPQQGTELTELEINCVITEPLASATIVDDRVTVRGVAYTGGKEQVAKVEVSADSGATWLEAEFVQAPADDRWAWRRFECEVSLPADGEPGARGSEVEILARASDTAGRSQPADASGIWNFKGYMNNAWCRVVVRR